MKRIAVMILAAVMVCLCLVSCGGGDYVGKWELKEMESGGMTLKDEVMGVPVAVMFQFEFKDGGKGTMKQNDEEENSETITWEEKDGGIVVKPADDKKADDDGPSELKFKLEDGLLVCTMEEKGQSATIKLTKVDEFTVYDKSSSPFASDDE